MLKIKNSKLVFAFFPEFEKVPKICTFMPLKKCPNPQAAVVGTKVKFLKNRKKL